MNYLAHMFLSDGTPEGLIGNLAGDFVRGIDVSMLTPGLQAGVALHRAVDRFTDAHPVVKRSRERLPESWRHYRGVLVDVFYDHFLARDFSIYANEPLGAFAARVYRALRANYDSLPPRLRSASPVMIERDWLRAYAHVEGLHVVLQGMSRRARRPVALHDSVATLVQHYAAFESDFKSFFPELVQFASCKSM
jgi:acyl carrier protein phosphodiesterase